MKRARDSKGGGSKQNKIPRKDKEREKFRQSQPQIDVEEQLEEAEKLTERGGRFLGEDAIKYLNRANEIFSKIQSVEPENYEAIFGRGKIFWLLASKYTEIEKKLECLDQSIQAYQQCTQINPNDPYSYFNLGQSFHEAAELFKNEENIQQSILNYEKASVEFEKAYQLHQSEGSTNEDSLEDSIDSLMSNCKVIGELASLVNNVEQSNQFFNIAFQRLNTLFQMDVNKTRPDILIAWGELIQAQAEYQFRTMGVIVPLAFDTAISKVSEALLSEYVEPVEGLCSRGDMYYSQSNCELEHFKKVGSMEGVNPDTIAQHLLEKLEKAEKDYKTALELEPDFPSIISSLGDVYLLRYRILQNPDLLRNAITYYQKSMSIPFKKYEDPDTLYNLACAESLLGNQVIGRQWLLKWKAKVKSYQEVFQDEDFIAIRNTDWFRSDFLISNPQ